MITQTLEEKIDEKIQVIFSIVNQSEYYIENKLEPAKLVKEIIEALVQEAKRETIREFANNIDKDLMFPIEKKYKNEIIDLSERYIQKYLKSNLTDNN